MAFSSNSVIAKARAVYGRSLTREDLSRLCSRRSVPEAAEYLKGTPRYQEALSGIDPRTIHRGQLEALLDKAVFSIFEGFSRFDLTESRWFFREIVARLEAEQILTAIQAVENGSTDTYITALPTFLIKSSKLDLLELGRCRSLPEINRALAGTQIGDMLAPLLRNSQVNIREVERRLCTRYYISCMRVIEKNLRGKQRSELKRAFLKSIDMKNVVTCCRMRAFGYNSGQTAPQLIPFRYRLSPDAVEELMKQSDISAIERTLSELGFRTDSSAEFQTIEQLTEKISLDFLRRTLRLSGNSSTVLFCLIECLETELHNVKTIIEGIRYNIPSDEIYELLVL